jgi:DNA invertase Pin-like site-specific DNA recombinase
MKSPKEPIRGVALVRVSTAGQADDSRASIPAQREAIRKIAQAYSIEIAPEHHFELTDVSGASVLLSPDYQRFLRAVQQPDVSAVVTKEFSRLMRPENFHDYAILQIFVDHGITLYMPDTVMNMCNRQDWFMAGIKTAMAGMERFDIRQRMMDGKEAMRRRGRHPSAAHTLARGIGYTKGKGWFYKEEELAVVRMLFDLFLNGEHNYAQLSKLTGIPRSSVRVVLTNPVYAGVMTYRTKHDLSSAGMYPRKEGKRGYRRKVVRTSEELIKVKLPMEPVISIEQHQQILDTVENLRAPRAKSKAIAHPRFTYRGYLRCGFCGGLMYSHSAGTVYSTGPKDFYYCKSKSPRERQKRLMSGEPLTCENRHMSREKLERMIDADIVSRLTEVSFLTRVIRSHIENAKRSAETGDNVKLGQRLTRLQDKRKRIIDTYIDGTIGREEKQSRLTDVDMQIADVSRQLVRHHPPAFDPAQILDITRVFREWTFLGMEAKRRLMEQLLPEIYVDRYEIKGVSLKIPIGGDNDSYLPEVAAKPSLGIPAVRPETGNLCDSVVSVRTSKRDSTAPVDVRNLTRGRDILFYPIIPQIREKARESREFLRES